MITPEIVNRLRMAKYQLGLAHRELSSGMDFGAWQASILVHDAVETCLMALVDATGAIPKRERPDRMVLTDYPDRLEKRSGGRPFFDARAIEDVAEMRNPAKHRGQYPSASDVDRLVSRLRDVLNQNCKIYLDGLTLDEVSLADMIERPELRDLVKAAETHIEAARFTDAVVALEHCWLLALVLYRARFGLEPRRPPSFHFSPRNSRAEDALIQVEKSLDEIYARLDLLDLGIDLVHASTFAEIGFGMWLTEGGLPHYYRKGDEEIRHTPEAVHFALTFVIENLLRFQAIALVRRSGDYYELETTRTIEYFDARKGDSTPEGVLPVGHRIAEARYGFGRKQENEWFWDDPTTKQTFFIPVSAAKIVRAITRQEHTRIVIQRLMDERDSQTPPTPHRK
jgi:hypothetical protein